MKVLVAVTEVDLVDDEFELDGLSIDDRYVTQELNEWDEYAVEAAVQIAETGEDVEVVTVTVGPEDCEETIRQALAKGADRAVRIWDDAIDGAGLLGPRTTAALMAPVVEQEEPDLVLTGVQSGDAAFAATGVALAERVDYGWAAVVNDLDLDTDAGVAHVHRELEGGVDEVTDVDLPAVLTIQTGLNDPRYASLRGIRQAQSKELAVETLADLGLDASVLDDALTQTDLYEPTVESEARIIEGDAESAAGELAGVLRDEGVGE